MLQLIFDGQHLDDIKLVLDYNIQRKSTVDLQLPFDLHAPFPKWIKRSINITIITLTGKRFVISAKGTDTIHYVKSRIQDVEFIPPGEHAKPGSEHNF